MRKKTYKILSLMMAAAVTAEVFGSPALAAGSSGTVVHVSEDGKTTTVTTETEWASPEGESPRVEGRSVTTESTVVDDEGRIIRKSGRETGHESTSYEETDSRSETEEKEPVTETVTGAATASDALGAYETVDSSESSAVETVDPVFPDGGVITVGLTPGSTAAGTAEADRAAMAGQLDRPAEEDCDIVDEATGEVIGHRSVTVEDITEEDGTVVGFTSTSTVETFVTAAVPGQGPAAQIPELPRPHGPVTDGDGVTTRVDVTPYHDADGNLTGCRTTTTRTRRTLETTSGTILPERPAEGDTFNRETGETASARVSELRDVDGTVNGYEVTTTVTDGAGNTRTCVETLRGTETSSALTEVTDVTEADMRFTRVGGSAMTTTTRTTVTETKRVMAGGRTVTAGMGDVTAGEEDGILATGGIKPDVAEPEVGRTDPGTDLYHRADKGAGEFDPDGYDLQWLGEYGLESAIRVDAVETDGDGTVSPSDGWQAHQFVLEDKDGRGHYVYCADFAVSPREGFRYDMENVEDAGYYDSEAAAHIRAIARDGYWGTSEGAGSLDAVKRMLADACDSGEIRTEDYGGLVNAEEVRDRLTDGMALAATQAAIWTFGNSGGLTIDREEPFTRYYQAASGRSWRELDSREKALTKALYDCLTARKEAPDDESTLINERNFAAGAALTVGRREEGSGRYEADLTFTLAVTPDMEDDDLLVHVAVDGEDVLTRRLAGDDTGTRYGLVPRSGDGICTLSGLELEEGADIELRITGTQDIGEGAYLFTSEIKDGAAGAGSGISSQTFVGIESGRQAVDLSVPLRFTVDEASAGIVTETAGVTERKTDTAGTARIDVTTVTGGRTGTEVTVTTVRREEREWDAAWERDYPPQDPDPGTPGEPDHPEDPGVPDVPDAPGTPEKEPPAGDIPEPDVPPGTPEEPPEEVPEREVPAADVPRTGDGSGFWHVLTVLALAGLGIMGWQEIRDREKDKEKETSD